MPCRSIGSYHILLHLTTDHVDTPTRLLAEHLRADAHLREKSVAKILAVSCAACIPVILLLAPFAGWRVATATTVRLACFIAYYLALIVALKRGWYHPAVPWANVLVEVSFPLPFLLVLARHLGPETALGAAINLAWSGLVMLSGLRTNRRLSIVAGVVAASENLLFYVLVIRPHMPTTHIEAFTPGEIALRSFVLLAAGFAASSIAGHLLRKAGEALRAVRARELMGKYILHERIGSGGMAEVMRATYCPEGGFEKVVAVKRILPAFSDDPEFVSMFRDEARICALLQHPNVVQVFDVGRFEGRYFLAMEYVDGLPLHWLLRALARPLPIAAVTFIGAELAAALDYIHTRTAPDGTPLHLVHRDVNPPNILISRFGEVKLTDFGVAQAAARASVTRTGLVRGKLQYLAPEQLDRGALDGRTDLFALGLTLYETLTGKRLLAGDHYAPVRLAMMGPFAPPSQARTDVPAELDALVLQLLDPAPEKRPATGASVLHSLQALPGEAAPFPAGKPLLAAALEGVHAALLRGEAPPAAEKTAETPPLYAP